jgi:hypothetical protein
MENLMNKESGDEALYLKSEVTIDNISVAHQIVGKFIDELKTDGELTEIANRLEKVIFTGKPTEAELREALFGGPEL